MELIKKHYQLIISYGIILFGIIVFSAILIIKPSRTVLEEAHTYDQQPKLKSIEFPFSQTVKSPGDNLSFIELRFGDDSINQYQYTITASYESTPFFNHTYNDEISNIVRIPMDPSIITPTQDGTITIRIDCNNTCNDAHMEFYNIDNTQTIKTLFGLRKVDYGLLWYGLFPIAIGFTLLPLAKGNSKHV
jgi:hypothetical protein